MLDILASLISNLIRTFTFSYMYCIFFVFFFFFLLKRRSFSGQWLRSSECISTIWLKNRNDLKIVNKNNDWIINCLISIWSVSMPKKVLRQINRDTKKHTHEHKYDTKQHIRMDLMCSFESKCIALLGEKNDAVCVTNKNHDSFFVWKNAVLWNRHATQPISNDMLDLNHF